MGINKYKELLARTQDFRKKLGKSVSGVLLYSGILTFFVIIYDLGFPTSDAEYGYFERYYLIYLQVLIYTYSVRNFLNIFNQDKRLRVKLFDVFSLLSVFLLNYWLVHERTIHFMEELRPYYKYIIAPFFVFFIIVEFSRNANSYYSRNLNPALLFVLAFFILVLSGTGLLLLPNSTVDSIRFSDALFTATSSVCITGLASVDISSTFTQFGQAIIMLLMQIGGLGIMTFAGFIAHMFSGGQTFQQQMMLKEMVSDDKISEVMRTLYKIVFITLFVEIIGGVFIFFSTLDLEFESIFDRVFFSAFTTVSAFCNAGLMTIENGLQNDALRFHYPLHLVIAFLFLFGGIGFPIVLNFYKNAKLFISNSFNLIFKGRRFHHVPYAISVNSRIMLITTGIIALISFLAVFILEYDGILKGHSFGGKMVTAFFAAATPRSAGFNTYDMSLLSFPTVMLYLLLMWIGASPGGTGGGIRTTTFAVATLNFWTIARGKDKIIIFKREVPQASIRRAFAIIMLSIICMGIATFLVYSFDGHLSLVNVAFEVFSAFNNCGLSLGITPELSEKSKFVLSISMFVGRVGGLTLLSAFIFKSHFQNVRYPTEEIIF